ncbi:MAG: hypothetical protein ACK55I_10355, partial [bacterium]
MRGLHRIEDACVERQRKEHHVRCDRARSGETDELPPILGDAAGPGLAVAGGLGRVADRRECARDLRELDDAVVPREIDDAAAKVEAGLDEAFDHAGQSLDEPEAGGAVHAVEEELAAGKRSDLAGVEAAEGVVVEVVV